MAKSFFFFIFSVCLGASNDIDKCLELAKETPKLARKSGHQLERFLLRRANQMVKEHEALSQEYCLLLVYELLYLWNALGACLKHSHTAIQIGKPHFLSLTLGKLKEKVLDNSCCLPILCKIYRSGSLIKYKGNFRL